MDKVKEIALNETFAKAINIGFGNNDISLLKECFADNVMGINDADQIFTSIEGLHEIIQRQRVQSERRFVTLSRNRINQDLSVNGNVAVIVEEIHAEGQMNGELVQFDTRVSAILECKKHEWKIINWHESKLSQVPSDIDPFSIKERKQTSETIEKLVAERTATLAEKVEAQARETQIQLGLEKVRSRSMAVHKSEEFTEVILIVYEQLQVLGLHTDAISINTYIDNSSDTEVYICGRRDSGPHVIHYRLPYFDDLISNERVAASNSGIDFFTNTYNKQEKDIFYAKVFELSELRHAPDELKQIIRNSDAYTISLAIAKHCMIVVNDFEGKILAENDVDIIKRFARVFDQSYTRFLDLQKAEAQAHEAQIEVSLERVRSRALAMQKSDELNELIATVYTELTRLDLVLDRCFIMIFNPSTHDATWWMGSRESASILHGFHVKHNNHPPHLAYLKAWQEGREKWTYILEGEVKKRWDDFNFSETELSTLPNFVIDNMKNVSVAYIAASFNNFGCLTTGSLQPLSEHSFNILLRFAKVFEQTYTRFLDLQKAEAQARETQIQLGLERVRSSAMAMHSTNDFLAVTKVLREQIAILGEKEIESIVIHLYNEKDDTYEAWYSYRNPGDLNREIVDGRKVVSWSKKAKAASDKQHYYSAETDYTIVAGKAMLIEWYDYLHEQVPEVIDVDDRGNIIVPDILYYNYSKFTGGSLLLITNSEASEKSKNLLKRSAQVFNQAYTRFLDLQKAEAQAKEAKIEAALEKVRSRSLAMHKSHEIKDVVITVMDKINELQIDMNGGVSLATFNEGSKDLIHWYVNPDHVDGAIEMHLPYFDNKLFLDFNQARETGIELLPVVYSFEEKNEYFNYAFENSGFKIVPGNLKEWILEQPCFGYSVAIQKHSAIFFNDYTGKYFSDTENQVLIRFAKVFEQAYIRFLDLQKAETQAREAIIENALEKVRSMAMAMHNSEDVNATIAVFYRQLDMLGLKPRGCGVGLMHRDERVAEISTMNATETGEAVAVTGTIKMVGHPLLEGIYDGWLHQKEYHTVLRGDAIKDYYKILKPQISFPSYHGDAEQYGHFFTFKEGGVYAWTATKLQEDELNIYRRFTSVLSLTYRRYLDLKEAEMQAREATFEASLERVRAKAMSMQSSKNLAETIRVFYHEMSLLKITPRRCGLGLLDKETRMAELSTVNNTMRGSSIELSGRIKMEGHPVLENIYNNWLIQKEYHAVLRGNAIKEYYKLIRPHIDLAEYPADEVQYGYFFFFPNGGVYAWTDKVLAEDELKIYRRFTSVLSLTYKRYNELKEAEERTQLAIRQSSLDRIRAEIASMRTTNDLQRITPSVWKELMILSVPFFRCGVFIINETEETVHSYLSTPDGKPLGVLHLNFTSSGTTANLVKSWRQNQVYKEHWSRQEFLTWIDSMIGQGQMITPATYQAGSEPPESLTLQFVPFTQGMLYVGSAHILNDVQIELVQSLADAFSTAYARYEDFNKLELAKQQVDNTLKELQSAQQQLIQSEKMASLGELTAGIAHEIQNPLNFINNFSDVNKELIEELQQAALIGNLEEVKALSSDLRDNEQKINHHGKRADAIVKGMLQHSRTNTGQKELIDINALADEYLRLSYHGCRAKDKAFNTAFTTSFDESIKQIAVVPQEIGRVLLNIFNNAFYAVSDRKKLQNSAYEPRVSVTTQKIGDEILITINDNGNGIPPNIVDKIFQPFFTTKPTGQGTGLGLSLAYDIVRAHGGELKLETRQGHGSEFIITLPA